jgi:hypothetical protein
MMDIKKVLAGLGAVLFVITGIAALFLFNIERRAFSSQTYKTAFERQNLYERMPAILAGALYTSIGQGGNADPYLKALTVQDWENSISNLLPPDDLKALSDGTLDSVFDYLNNKTDSVVIPIAPIKSQLAGPQGAAVVMQIIAAQPECTVEQLVQMGLGFLGGDIALCKPPPELMGLVAPAIESQLQLMTNTIPDEITLITNTKSGTPEDPRLKLNQSRLLMKITPVLPILFLLGILAFAVRSLLDWLKWWGWPFLATGLTATFIAFIGAPILGLAMQGVISSQIGFLPPILISALQETVNAVSREMLGPVVIQGLTLAALGLGMVGSEYYLSRKNTK